MKRINDAEIKQTLSRLTEVPPANIGHWMLHLETPAGTLTFHNLPDQASYFAIMRRLAHDTGVIDLTEES